MNKSLVIGLDLGGTKTAAGVVTGTGKLLSSIRVPTPASGVERDLGVLHDLARAAVVAARIPWRSIRAIGVGVPGAVDPKTETVWAPNLPGWRRVPLALKLGRALGRPVFVEGDRNVQALAEAWLGAGRGRVRNMVFLTVGTGIGAGLILDGRLVPGTRGVAGAAGWMTIEGSWRPIYARLGCLEALGAGPAVARLAEESLRASSRSLIRRLAGNQRLTAEVVAEAARRGDRTARRVLEVVGSNLGRGVASIVSLLNPELVVIGGGLAGAGELILAPLRRTARKWGQPLSSRQVRIVRSRLGDDAGVLGAARYAFIRMEEKD
jgi:glucokinase